MRRPKIPGLDSLEAVSSTINKAELGTNSWIVMAKTPNLKKLIYSMRNSKHSRLPFKCRDYGSLMDYYNVELLMH